jgi:hypothetical protein
MAGVGWNDRVLAGEVRTITLKKIKALFEIPEEKRVGDKKRLHDAVLIRLAGNVLPKLNEISGPEGTDLKIVFDEAYSDEEKGQ